MAGSIQQQNSATKVLDKFTSLKSNSKKHNKNHQPQNSMITGFGVVGNAVCFASSHDLDEVDRAATEVISRENEMCNDFDQHQESPRRRPSLASLDSSTYLSLKMKISKSFSKNSEDSDTSYDNSSLSSRGSSKTKSQVTEEPVKPEKKQKTKKDVSESNFFNKTKKNSFKKRNFFGESTNRSPTSDLVVQMNNNSLEEHITPSRQNSYIKNVVMELLSTEKSYIKDLKDILQGYRAPLQNSTMISRHDLNDIFSNLKSVYNFNRKFLKSLTECESDVTEICQLFIDNVDNFNIYTYYCTNYPRSVEALDRFNSRSENQALIDRCQKQLRHLLPLHTYLFKPVQRILKYHLLLRNLAEHYDESLPGFEVVSRAYKCMVFVAGNINEVKRKQDKHKRLQEISKNIQGLGSINLQSLGELVIEGKFTGVKSKEEWYALLLERGMLITKPRKDSTLTFKTLILCTNLTLVEIIPREPLAFQVLGYGSPRCECTLQAQSPEQKRAWCREIKTVILDSIEAAVPEKARMLLMLPGGHQEAGTAGDSKRMSYRKYSEDLDQIRFAPEKKSLKTSTPIQPFLRSKLRKTALPRVNLEKKIKGKGGVGKRRSRSLESLRKLPDDFPIYHADVKGSSKDLGQNHSLNNAGYQARKETFDEFTEYSTGDTGTWTDLNLSEKDQHTSGCSQSQSIKRAGSFKQAMVETNIYESTLRKSKISCVRSLSVENHSTDEDEDNLENNYDNKDVESCSSESDAANHEVDVLNDVSPIKSHLPFETLDRFFEINLRESSMSENSLSTNASTVTLSSMMSLGEEEKEEELEKVRRSCSSSGSQTSFDLKFLSSHQRSEEDCKKFQKKFVASENEISNYGELSEYDLDHLEDCSDKQSSNSTAGEGSVYLEENKLVNSLQLSTCESGSLLSEVCRELSVAGNEFTSKENNVYVNGVAVEIDSKLEENDLIDFGWLPSVKRRTFHFENILREKDRLNLIQSNSGNKRTSVLRRRSAFYTNKRIFIPRRSKFYDEVEEVRKISLPTILFTECSERFGSIPKTKLSLSETSLPLSPPLDDDAMIDILLTKAQDQEKAGPNNRAEKNPGAVSPALPFRLEKGELTEESVEQTSNYNNGVKGLLELIASCSNLPEEFNESFEKIKLKDDFGYPEENHRSNVDSSATNLLKVEADVDHHVVQFVDIPILKINESETAVEPLPKASVAQLFRGDRSRSYVFRLARAYSNRFKRLSKDMLSEESSGSGSYKDQTSDGQILGDGVENELENRKSSLLFFDPAMESAERKGIVKQRIKEFQPGAT